MITAKKQLSTGPKVIVFLFKLLEPAFGSKLRLLSHWADYIILIAAARIREILESVGLAQESLPSNVVSSAHVLAKVANLLDVRDTELSR